MFTCDLYAGSPPPYDLERLRTTMQRRVVDFVRVGYFIPLNGPLNGHPPSIYTTIAALSAKIYPKNRTDFSPCVCNLTPIIASILCAYLLPVRDLCASAFCVCPLFFTTKNKKEFRMSPQLRFLHSIFTRQFSRRCANRRLLKTAHSFARLRTTKHNGRFYSFINKISFHGSMHFIFTGSLV